MIARNLESIRYLPLLDVRPAELAALQELPNKDKDALVPLFRLRPWVGAAKLAAALNRIKLAFGVRACFLELGEEEPTPDGGERLVHSELRRLRQPTEGFKAWVDFFGESGNEHFIPVVQLLTDDPNGSSEIGRQMRALYSLNRGLLLRADMLRLDMASVTALAAFVSHEIGVGKKFILLLDYGKQGQSFLAQHAAIASSVERIRTAVPDASMAMSASSFPESFTSIQDQEIFERLTFERVSRALGGGFPSSAVNLASD
jgi:hypothetical protein